MRTARFAHSRDMPGFRKSGHIRLCIMDVPYPPENKPPFFSSKHAPDWGGGLLSNTCNAPRQECIRKST